MGKVNLLTPTNTVTETQKQQNQGYKERYCLIFTVKINNESKIVVSKDLCLKQSFGSVTFWLADPDLLDLDPHENAFKFKSQSGKFITYASHNILWFCNYIKTGQ